MTWGRHGLDERIRAATAGLRGAALAIGASAAAVGEQLGRRDPCPDGDRRCVEAAYADLLRHRHRVALATREISRLERTDVDYAGATPAGAPTVGWHVPSVTAARRLVDQAHDVVAEALDVVRATMAGLDMVLPTET